MIVMGLALVARSPVNTMEERLTAEAVEITPPGFGTSPALMSMNDEINGCAVTMRMCPPVPCPVPGEDAVPLLASILPAVMPIPLLAPAIMTTLPLRFAAEPAAVLMLEFGRLITPEPVRLPPN